MTEEPAIINPEILTQEESRKVDPEITEPSPTENSAQKEPTYFDPDISSTFRCFFPPNSVTFYQYSSDTNGVQSEEVVGRKYAWIDTSLICEACLSKIHADSYLEIKRLCYQAAAEDEPEETETKQEEVSM